MHASVLIVYFIRSITRSILITPHMQTGNALFRTRALMWPSASALLSLMTSCLPIMMMKMKANRAPEIMNLAITLLCLNVIPLPLPLCHPRERGFSSS
jgi:hypothetical protein